MALANLSRLRSKYRRGQLRSALLRWRLALALPVNTRRWLKLVTPLTAWQEVNLPTGAGEHDLRTALAERSAALPRISVLMPVFRPSLEHLDEAIASVREQIYDDWQLVMVDDGSGDASLDARLTVAAAQDPRILHRRNSANLGISNTTNAAFAESDGDVILFLDNDDLLAPDCLAEIALFFAENPTCDMVYSDHDKIDMSGARISPQFKSAWSPTLLLAYMYLGHVVAVRRQLFERIEGLRAGFEGSQDYDFALRATELARGVGHIPKLLYHWRMTPGSTAVSGAEKPSSFDTGIIALRDTLRRRAIVASVSRPDWAQRRDLGLFALEFSAEGPSIDVIVPVTGAAGHVAGLLRTLLDADYGIWSLTLVGSQGTPLTEAAGDALIMLRERGIVPRLVHHEDGASLADLCNAGASASTSDALLFLTQSFEPRARNWLRQLTGYLTLDGVGAVGPRFIGSDGCIVHAGLLVQQAATKAGAAFAGRSVEMPGALYLARTPHESGALPANGLIVRRSAFAQTGGFEAGLDDSVAIGIHFAAALRANAWRELVCADVDVVAAMSGVAEWSLMDDPYYNTNFTTEQPFFEPRPWRSQLRRAGPIRVLFVSHNLELEGAPIVLFDLVTGLAEEGAVKARILSPRDGPLAARYRERGIEVEYFDMPVLRHDAAQLDLCLNRIGPAIERHRSELVFANTLEMAFAVNAAAARSVGAILWHHEAGSWRTAFRKYPAAVRASALAALAQAYRTIFVARATHDKWLPVCLRGNFQVIPHAQAPSRITANLERWTRPAARARLRIGEDESCVLLLGSVCARKGQIDLVRAAAAMPEDLCAKTRFFIVGPVVQQRYGRKFERELKSLPAKVRSRIEVVGGVEDVALFYRAADIFVCCSRSESAPRVLLEAMSFGLPIITTPVDGIPEMVGTSAQFYRQSRTRELAASLVGLITSSAIRDELGARALAQAANYSDYADMLAGFLRAIREGAATSNASWLTLPVRGE